MTTRGVKILAAVVAAALVGCGANTTTSPGNAGTSGASTEFSGYVPYEPITTDPGAAALTANYCATPTPAPTALTVDSATTGSFSVSMVDAVNPNVVGVWVNILKVSVHVAGAGWTELEGASWVNPVNLLTLKDGVEQFLGIKSLPAGTVTQIRLLIQTDLSTGSGVGSEVVNFVEVSTDPTNPAAATKKYPLKTPSGYESGLKIMGPWRVENCKRTRVTIDFDALQSIWYHPTGRELGDLGTEWILRPVIRVKSVVTENTCPTSPTTTTTPPTNTILPPPTGGTETGGTGETGSTGTGGTTGGSGSTGTVADGGSCTAGTECVSGTCTNGTCAASGGTTTGGTSGGDTSGGSSTGTGTGSTGTGGTSTGGTVPAGSVAEGGSCTAPAECASNNCLAGKCVASGGTTTTTPGSKGTGEACVAGTECSSGGCYESKCSAPGGLGATCTAPAECTSGSCVANQCAAGGTSVTCTVPAECLSNTCYPNNTCAVSPVGGKCNAAGDCGSGVLCVAGTCVLPTGASCSAATECMSNSCTGTSSTCQVGGQGATCVADTDCNASLGLSCVPNACGGISTCETPSRMTL